MLLHLHLHQNLCPTRQQQINQNQHGYILQLLSQYPQYLHHCDPQKYLSEKSSSMFSSWPSVIPSVVRIHSVWFYSIYSPPTSSWTWFHPVLQPRYVFFNSTFSPSTFSHTWYHPVLLKPFKLHPKIISHQTLLRDHFFFVCRYLIISL